MEELFKDVAKWPEITQEFTEAAKSLEVGELVTTPGFNLFSGVQSLEVCFDLNRCKISSNLYININ